MCGFCVVPEEATDDAHAASTEGRAKRWRRFASLGDGGAHIMESFQSAGRGFDPRPGHYRYRQ